MSPATIHQLRPGQQRQVSPLERFTWVTLVKASPTEKAVLLSLAVHANTETLVCWPSQTTVAKEAGCSRRTAIRALDAMTSRGLIVKERVNFKVNRYRLNIDPSLVTGWHKACDKLAQGMCQDVTQNQTKEQINKPDQEREATPAKEHHKEPESLSHGKPSKEGKSRTRTGPQPATPEQIALAETLLKEKSVFFADLDIPDELLQRWLNAENDLEDLTKADLIRIIPAIKAKALDNKREDEEWNQIFDEADRLYREENRKESEAKDVTPPASRTPSRSTVDDWKDEFNRNYPAVLKGNAAAHARP